jgi:hypothetical protein
MDPMTTPIYATWHRLIVESRQEDGASPPGALVALGRTLAGDRLAPRAAMKLPPMCVLAWQGTATLTLAKRYFEHPQWDQLTKPTPSC